MAYSQDEFTIKQLYEKQSLDAKLKFGRITQEQYNAELKKLSESKEAFEQKQLNVAKGFLDKLQKEKEKKVKDALEKELNYLERGYAAEIAKLQEAKSSLNPKKDAEQIARIDLEITSWENAREEKRQEYKKKLTAEAIAEKAKMYERAYLQDQINEAKSTKEKHEEHMKALANEKAALEDLIAYKKERGEDYAKLERQLQENQQQWIEGQATQKINEMALEALKALQKFENDLNEKFDLDKKAPLIKRVSEFAKTDEGKKGIESGKNLVNKFGEAKDGSWIEDVKTLTSSAKGLAKGVFGDESEPKDWQNDLEKYKKYIGYIQEGADIANKALEFFHKQELKRIQEEHDEKVKNAQAALDAETKRYKDARDAKIKALEEGKEKEMGLAEQKRRDEQKEITAKLDENLLTEEEYQAKIFEMGAAYKQTEADQDKMLREGKQAAENLYLEETAQATIDFNKIKKEADEKLAKDQAELKLKAAKREKTMAIITATTNTALAVLNALSTAPFLPLGLAMAVVAGAMGAAQIAAIASQPLPQAARGGLIGGRSHALGGTLIEAEAGEAIINRRSTTAFAPLLSAINQLGGGVPFAATTSDGGFAQREYSRQNQPTLSVDDMRSAMREAVGEVKIYTAIEDINDGSKRYSEITDTSVF